MSEQPGGREGMALDDARLWRCAVIAIGVCVHQQDHLVWSEWCLGVEDDVHHRGEQVTQLGADGGDCWGLLACKHS